MRRRVRAGGAIGWTCRHGMGPAMSVVRGQHGTAMVSAPEAVGFRGGVDVAARLIGLGMRRSNEGGLRCDGGRLRQDRPRAGLPRERRPPARVPSQ